MWRLLEKRTTVLLLGRQVSFYSQEIFPADLRAKPLCLETKYQYSRRYSPRNLSSSSHKGRETLSWKKEGHGNGTPSSQDPAAQILHTVPECKPSRSGLTNKTSGSTFLKKHQQQQATWHSKPTPWRDVNAVCELTALKVTTALCLRTLFSGHTLESGMVHLCSSSTWEAETGGTPWVGASQGLKLSPWSVSHNETLSQKNQKETCWSP